ncbi:MAG: DUF3667 domain-containing protein [Saprospiraceae bacterium]
MSDNTNNCKNCGEPLLQTAKFCANCGQKNTDGRIKVRDLFSEFFDAVFNIESRTFLTIRHLFVPGRLTSKYFEGQHKRYVHPLRILLVTSILLVIAMSYRGVDKFTNHKFIVKERILKEAERELVFDSLILAQRQTSSLFKNDTVDQALDSLHLYLRQRIGWYSDSVNLTRYFHLSGDEIPEWISRDDFLTLKPEELVEKYKKKGWFKRQVFKQKVKFIQDESRLSSFLVGSFSWIALLIMPVITLVIQFFYRKQHRYYIEHLVFSFHIHSFFFLVIFFFLFTIRTPGTFSWLFFLAILGLYLYLALKKVYQESWKKTFLKWSLLSIIYSALLLVFVIFSLLFSFFIF